MASVHYTFRIFTVSLVLTGVIFLIFVLFPTQEDKNNRIPPVKQNSPVSTYHSRIFTVTCPWLSDIQYGRMIGAFTHEKNILNKIDDSYKWAGVEFVSEDTFDATLVSGKNLKCIYEKLYNIPERGPNFFGRNVIYILLKDNYKVEINLENPNLPWTSNIRFHSTGNIVRCEESREVCEFVIEKQP